MMDDRFSIARKDRDAWAAIRGYVYQVDTTLIRWLDLTDGEILELECGEDIDLLAPSLTGDLGFERTLEQVKCLDRTLTLRSRASREALSSFAEHMEENPALPLRFRFVTTAVPAEESPAPPLMFTPGIQLWESIRTRRLDPRQQVDAIASVAGFLQLVQPPDGVRTTTWQKFVASTHDLGRFAEFISRFEWSTGASGPNKVENDVQEALLRQGYAVGNVGSNTGRED